MRVHASMRPKGVSLGRCYPVRVETVEKVRNGDEMSGNFAQGSVDYSYSREVRGTDGEI